MSCDALGNDRLTARPPRRCVWLFLTALPVLVAAQAQGGADPVRPMHPIGDNTTCWSEPNKIGCFTNMDKVFPMRELRNAAPVLELKEKRQPVTYRFGNTEYKAAEFLDHHRNLGLLIIKNGQIVEEQYRHGTGPATRFYSASMAKTVVGMLVGIALDKGVIKSLSDPAERYVAELAGTPYGRATIEQLLRMSSGVKMTTYDGTFQDDENRFFQTMRGLRPKAVLDFLRDVPGGEFAPGSKFRYMSTDTVVLGYVLTKASGKTVSDLCSEWIWQHIGADQNAMWRLMKDGVEMGGGDMFARLRDYGRLGILMANDGKSNGMQVVPSKWVPLATDADAQPHQFRPGHRGPGTSGYGYQTWIMAYRTRTFALTGACGQSMFVQPRSGIVMVITGATPEAISRGDVDERYALWHGVLRSLDGYAQ